MVKGALSLYHQTLYATANVSTPREDIPLDKIQIQTTTEPWESTGFAEPVYLPLVLAAPISSGSRGAANHRFAIEHHRSETLAHRTHLSIWSDESHRPTTRRTVATNWRRPL